MNTNQRHRDCLLCLGISCIHKLWTQMTMPRSLSSSVCVVQNVRIYAGYNLYCIYVCARSLEHGGVNAIWGYEDSCMEVQERSILRVYERNIRTVWRRMISYVRTRAIYVCTCLTLSFIYYICIYIYMYGYMLGELHQPTVVDEFLVRNWGPDLEQVYKSRRFRPYMMVVTVKTCIYNMIKYCACDPQRNT